MDIEYYYEGPGFAVNPLNLQEYQDEFFNDEIVLESEAFFELRKQNGILPHRLIDADQNELGKIKDFFNKHKKTFLFLYDGTQIVGSILYFGDYIQCMAVSARYQRKHYGENLVKHAVNAILTTGHTRINLKVLAGNSAAESMYQKLGFIKI